MLTTAVFVEMLIVGVLTSIWVALSTMSIFGQNWVLQTAASLKGWEIIASLFILTFCYMLGILVDRLADYLLEAIGLPQLFRKCDLIKGIAEHDSRDQKRMELRSNKKKVTEFFEYLRGQVRIVRSIAFNAPLIALSAVSFLRFADDFSVRNMHLVIIIIVAAFVTILTLFVHAILEGTYEIRLSQVKCKNITESNDT